MKLGTAFSILFLLLFTTKVSTQPSNWQFEFVGPKDVGSRVQDILIDRFNPENVYTSGISVINISRNGGDTWEQFTNFHGANPSSLCQAANGDLYAGTGHSFYGSMGVGIFKSIDEGSNWTVLSSTERNLLAPYSFASVNALLADPIDGQLIYAGTSHGLYISSNGGASWHRSGPTTSVQDLAFSADESRLFVGYNDGVYYTDSPDDSASFVYVLSGGLRVEVETSRLYPNVVLAAVASGFGSFDNIYRSVDKGLTWNPVDPVIPAANPSWDQLGGQLFYNFLFSLHPKDSTNFFIGGLDLWRFDGNWTQASSRNLGNSSYLPPSVHSAAWHPQKENVLFVGTDQGVFKSLDRGHTFFNINIGMKGAMVYDLSPTKDGNVVAGCQELGPVTINVDPLSSQPTVRLNAPSVGNEPAGLECAVSNLTDLKFVTYNNSLVGRSRTLSDKFEEISGDLRPGQFWTTMAYWETDKASENSDSLVFSPDSSLELIASGDGLRRSFTYTLSPTQRDARPIKQGMRVYSGLTTMKDQNGDGTLVGNGTAIFNATNQSIQIQFDQAPAVGASIRLKYATRFEAGDQIHLFSGADTIHAWYTLKSNLETHETLKIPNPIQSRLAISEGIFGDEGIALSFDALNLYSNQPLRWLKIPLGGQLKAMQFNQDGSSLYYASGTRVYRIDGIGELKMGMSLPEVFAILNIKTIYSAGGSVQSLSFNESFTELVITTNSNIPHFRVAVLNLHDSTSSQISHNLPSDLVVLEGIIDKTNPNRILLGTTNGLWGADKVQDSLTEWRQIAEHLFGGAQIQSIVQQNLPPEKASNSGKIYIGTYGRGIWSSANILGVDDEGSLEIRTSESNIKIFPNPNRGAFKLDFPEVISDDFELRILDLNGKAQRLTFRALDSHHVEVQSNELSTGIYFVECKNDSQLHRIKLIVSHSF